MPLIILLSLSSHAQVSGVGVGTTNPQQKLHIASPTGTIRVDGLNSPNNLANGGGVNNTYPLLVDSNGDFTLETKFLQNSGGSAAWTPASLSVSSITVPGNLAAPGTITAQLYSQSITVTKPSIIEVKYALSFDVKRSAILDLSSTRARRITNFFTVDAGTRKYGQSSKCFFSNDAATINAAGTMYNGATTYITLPAAGTYSLKLWGEVNTGTTNEATLVNFATGYSSFYLRLY